VGFFAEAGPLQVFVSNHLIPEDFSFVSTEEPCFVSSDEAVRIIAGAEIRLRIVGTRVDATEIVSTNSIKFLMCILCSCILQWQAPDDGVQLVLRPLKLRLENSFVFLPGSSA
jgi:DNA-directed RNA polymerase subunit E'/Rpb7